jgi:hypothetical protein
MTVRQLAKELGPFGITPVTVRFNEATAKGYYLKSFLAVSKHYSIPKFFEDTSSAADTPTQPLKSNGSGRSHPTQAAPCDGTVPGLREGNHVSQ